MKDHAKPLLAISEESNDKRSLVPAEESRSLVSIMSIFAGPLK